MKVTVDQDKCCAAGSCVMYAPTVFDQSDDDGTVVLLDAEPAAEVHEDVRHAAEACPAVAIELREDA